MLFSRETYCDAVLVFERIKPSTSLKPKTQPLREFVNSHLQSKTSPLLENLAPPPKEA